MRIVRAGPADASRLREVAIAAKRHWDYPDEWMARWEAQLEMSPEYVRRHELYAAILDGQIVGFHAILLRGSVCSLDDLWVLPSRIGTGLGRALFEHARARAIALGATRMEWDAEPRAVGFYEHMGARQIGAVVTSMEREVPVMAIDLPVRAGRQSISPRSGRVSPA